MKLWDVLAHLVGVVAMEDVKMDASINVHPVVEDAQMLVKKAVLLTVIVSVLAVVVDIAKGHALLFQNKK